MENVLLMNNKSKLPPPPGEILKDRLAAVIDGPCERDLPSAYTLRVKPDRRRVQLPIPPGSDRRRKP